MKLFFSICTLFTIMQLQLVDAGGFASKLLHDKYPALEVVLDLSNDKTYFVRDDVKHRQPITRIKKTMKLLYLCPPRFDWQITFTVKLGEPCLFPVKWSDEFEKVECESPVVPNIARQSTVKCGQFNQGTLHFVYHRIFNGDLVRSEMFANDYELLMNMNKNDMDNMTNVIHVYQVCFNHKTRQTYFVEYDVTSFKLHPPANPEEYGTEWYENIANFFGLQNVPQRYKKEYQSRYFEFIDSKASHHDYLMEQMLIPTVDLIENQAQKSIQTYLTVAPQWKSLQEDWSNLNKLIKRKIVTKKNVAFVDQPESTRNSSGVVCDTYGELRREHFSQLNFPEPTSQAGNLEIHRKRRPNHLSTFLVEIR